MLLLAARALKLILRQILPGAECRRRRRRG
jgi:hypothetical protein